MAPPDSWHGDHDPIASHRARARPTPVHSTHWHTMTHGTVITTLMHLTGHSALQRPQGRTLETRLPEHPLEREQGGGGATKLSVSQAFGLLVSANTNLILKIHGSTSGVRPTSPGDNPKQCSGRASQVSGQETRRALTRHRRIRCAGAQNG